MNKKIILVTHYRIYSASQALRDYIRKDNLLSLLYVSHPLPLKIPGIEESSYSEKSIGKKIINKASFGRKNEGVFISSVRDLLSTLIWVFKYGKSNVFIGVDNLNALAGIILKKIGMVKRVVYYTIDYFPTRFENKILNFIYHSIDKICVKYADETWNVSEVMVDAREQYNNMDRTIYNRQHTVPIGIWYENAPRKEFSQIDNKKLIFTGHLLAHMGVDLVIRSMPEILKKIPDVRFEIIGGGEEEDRLRELVKELKVSKSVKFWGWIRDRSKLEKIMSDGAIGLATFNTEILDDKVKNADPGKIKDYMLLGMPVIATNVISTANAIRKARCGLIINYQALDLVNAVVKLLKNPGLLREYRENALKYVSKFDYNLIFQKSLRRNLI